MIKEFQDFIAKGNVLDLAVALIMGTAFTAIVKAIVNNIIMPFVGWILGGRNFDDLMISLDGQVYDSLVQAQEAGAPVIAYGTVITAAINFIAVAAILFMIIKAYNQMKANEEAVEEEAAPAEPPRQEVLLEEIRDALKNRG